MTRIDAARAIFTEIGRHLGGDLCIELWDGSLVPLGPGARDDLRIRVAHPSAIGRLLRSPRLITLVEVYLSGDLAIVGGSPLDALGRWDHLRALALRRTVSRRLVARAALPFLWSRRRADHRMGFGARVGRVFGRGRDDQAMIAHHYDLSNAFYALFLDARMQYSSAVFADPQQSLDAAQLTKLDLICRKLQLSPDNRLLDVGCGWGGLAEHAAGRYGARVHGVTLSRAQHDAALARIAAAGLTDHVTIELRDYRTIDDPGGYHAIAQVGMFEHVGIDNHDAHFRQMHRLLAPNGLYLHQATTRRATHDLRRFRRRTAYMQVINRYIFPGGELDYLGLTITNLERHGFEIRDVDTMREHYQLTLQAWAQRLWANREAAIAEVGETRTRLWLLYLALSGTGFWRGVLCDFQTLAIKRQVGPSGLPLDRAALYRDG